MVMGKERMEGGPGVMQISPEIGGDRAGGNRKGGRGDRSDGK